MAEIVRYHVEIRRSYRHARAFNLGAEELARTVLEPWQRGRPVELGDREWDPRECKLTVLEGPELAPADLAMGQGWHNAERSGRDVTGRVLGQVAHAGEAGVVAVLADTAAARSVAATLLEQLGLRPVDWAPARARILAGATAGSEATTDGVGIGAALVVLDGPEAAGPWWLDAGLAIGALGARAIVAVVGAQSAPPELDDLAVIRLDPEQPASLRALALRLAQAGCEVTAPG